MKQFNIASFLLVAAFVLQVACTNTTTKNVSEAPGLTWELKQNLSNNEGESLAVLTIENSSSKDLPSKGWTLYFNYILPVRVNAGSGLEAVHVNGDLRALRPKDFKGLAVGESQQVELICGGSIVQYTDAPDGFYIVFDKEPEKAIVCKTKHLPLPIAQMNRTPDDVLPVQSAALRFEENQKLSVLGKNKMAPFIPMPSSYAYLKGESVFKGNISIAFPSIFGNEAHGLKTGLEKNFSGAVHIVENATDGDIVFKVNKALANEAYGLQIADNKITIAASTAHGAFYGVQSLLSMLPVGDFNKAKEAMVISNIEINDAPRFAYRGIFLDVARNFHSKESVLWLLDKMAMYKINKFHFHICDDEGWRVEIPGLPELTEFGSKRGHSVNEATALMPSFASGPEANPEVSHGCGFYTRTDFVEIVKYATERHIEVIPEVDMPGHARAAIKSMKKRYDHYMAQGDEEKATEYLLQHLEDTSKYQSVQGWTDNVIDIAMPSSYRFLEKIVDELALMFNEAGTTLETIHTGGDEIPMGVWENSPACIEFRNQNPQYHSHHELFGYFVEQFADMLAKKNIKAAGWEEVGLTQVEGEEGPNMRLVGKNIIPYIWNNMWGWGAEDRAYQLANAGYPVVLAHVTNFYFDLAYNKDPEERGYYWGGYIDTRKAWEYTPMDITLCAEYDRFGHAFTRSDLQKKVQALTTKGQQNILGLQGLLWAENSKGHDVLQYQYFPKLLGLAERAWSQQPVWATMQDSVKRVETREIAWNEFVNRVGQLDMPRLDNMGVVKYRIPLPGAIIKDGKLHANVRFQGLTIRYTTDGSEPNENSTEYTAPTSVSGKVKLAAFATNGRKSRVVEL
jgi:hexosaminidase